MSRRSGSTAWLDRHFLLIYAGIALLFGWQLFVPGYSLFRWDILTFCWPFVVDARAQILAGQFPFWSSAICCGTPILENIAIGVLYPLQLPCWILPLPAGYHLFLFLHVWLTFVGMHVLLRKGLGLGWPAAFLGALVYGANGYMRTTWDIQFFTGLPWLPLGLAAILHARRPGRAPLAILFTGLSYAMMLLAGDIQTALMWIPVAGLLALIHPARRRLVPVAIAGVTLGLLLAAPQWLTTALYLPETWRGTALGESQTLERSFNPVRLLELFVPHAFGNRDHWFGDALIGMQARMRLPWTPSFHIGLLGVLCTALSIRKRRAPAWRWAALVLLASMLLSFGRFAPVFPLWQRLPVIGGFRFPEKYLVWSVLALAVFAGYGAASLLALFDRPWMRRPRLRMVGTAAAIGMTAAAAAWLAGTALNAGDADFQTWILGRILTVAILWAAVAACSSLTLRRASGRSLVVVLFTLDLLAHWYVEQPLTGTFNPLAPPAVAQAIMRSGERAERFVRDLTLEQIPLPGYYSGLRPSEKQAAMLQARLHFNSPVLWGIRTPLGYSSLAAQAIRDFQLGLLDDEGQTRTNAAVTAAFCLDANVTWLVTAQSRLTELRDAGLAFDVFAKWPHDDPVVLLHVTNSRYATILPAESVPSPDQPEIVTVDHSRPGHMEITLVPGGDCCIEIKETFSRGWRGVDGQGRRMTIRPSPPFLLLDIPAGVSALTLDYRPVGWGLSLICFAAGLVGVGMLAVILFRPKGPIAAAPVPISPATGLIVVLLVAAALRIPGLFWGYGLMGRHAEYVQLHPDEPRFVEIARGLDSGAPFRKSYVLGLGNLLRAALAGGRIAGHDMTDQQLVMAARLVSLLAGLGLVGAAYALARALALSSRSSLVAAGLVAVNTLCVIHSHYGTADMLYVVLAYTFLVTAGTTARTPSAARLLISSILAGAAMATKFGLILIPSLLLLPLALPRRRGLWLACIIAVNLLSFWACQGFTFDAGSVTAIAQSARIENLGGFEHNKFLNPPVYAVQLIRILSIPVLVCLIPGCPRRSGDPALSGLAGWVIGLPLLLHATGILFLNLPLPRHLLMLTPFLLILAARGTQCAGRAGRILGMAALAWSALLAWTDGAAYRHDSRGAALEWLAGHVDQSRTAWSDPYFEKLPVDRFYKAAPAAQANVVLRHEGWFYRFRHSELSPFAMPHADQLYHATEVDQEIDQMLDKGVEDGSWRCVFRSRPSPLLPEQWLYQTLWGSFDKFAGESVILLRNLAAKTDEYHAIDSHF